MHVRVTTGSVKVHYAYIFTCSYVFTHMHCSSSMHCACACAKQLELPGELLLLLAQERPQATGEQ